MAPELANRHTQTFAGQDIRTLISVQASLRPQHPFVVWRPFSGPRSQWTYAEFHQRIQRFAAGLHARGVRAGDRVLVHLDNCPEAIFSWIGCAWMGAIAVTTNARASEDELAYFADDAQVVAGITQPRFAASVARACPRLKWLAVTTTDNGEDAGANRPDAASSFDAIDADPSHLPDRPFDPMAPFSVQYTSGTTSRPKGVLWTHANALWGARVNAAHEALGARDVHLVTLPLFHTNAQAYSVLATLWAGATVVVQPRFSASRFWPVSIEEGCTWASMIPFCVRALLAQPLPERHAYRQWGGGLCAPPTDAHFGIPTVGWWGMTETITHGTVGLIGLPNEPLSIGRPAPEYGIHIEIDGRPCEPGETGDLLVRGVRGLSLFAEYLNNPKATDEAFDERGLFITGDRVRIGETGALFFADRNKDMLKVGGENVAASEIERVLMTVPGLAEVAVVAQRHPMLDEIPVAFVRLDALAPQRTDPAQVERAMREQCASQLAEFKRPRAYHFVEDFPRSTLEKIAKAELRRQLPVADA